MKAAPGSPVLQSHAKNLHVVLCFLGVWIGAFGVTLLIQYLKGNLHNHFGTFADEATHYTTALMIRDYLSGHVSGSPVKFAQNYYQHYPKVGFGAWPPLFQMFLALWMLIFPVTAGSTIAATTLITGCFIATIVSLSRESFSAPIAILIGLAALVNPLLQELSTMAMADTLHAIGCVAALWAFGRYLSTRSSDDARMFGLATAASLLTKNNGMLLGIAIPGVVLLTNGWWILRRRSLWLALALVTILVGPWEIWTLPWVLGLVTQTETVYTTLPAYSRIAVEVFGAPILILALLETIRLFVSSYQNRKSMPPLYAAAISLAVATWLFHVILPQEISARYLLPALPALLILGASFLKHLHNHWLIPSPVLVALALLVIGCELAAIWQSSPRQQSNYPAVAKYIDGLQPLSKNLVILVSSEGNGEGLLVSELASREHPPERWVLRGTKVLSHSGFRWENYTSFYDNPVAMMAFLRSVPVQVLVFDRTPASRHALHHQILAQALEQFPNEWELLFRSSTGAECHDGYCDVDVYRLTSSFASRSINPQLLEQDPGHVKLR